MGSKDDKERGRRRSRSPSRSSSESDSSQERRHKKARKEKKEHKHKHKSKHQKEKKHGSEVDEQKLAAAKAFLEQHLKQTAGDAGGSSGAAALAAAAAAGGPGGSTKGRGSSKHREKPAGELPADVDPITMDDYFERSSEFTAWLQEVRHQYFNELTSEQTHAAFKEFVAAWNTGRLPLRFYTGLAAAPIKRTSHNWGFKSKQGGTGSAAAAASGAGRTGMSAYLADQQEQHADQRVAAAAERRSQRKEQKELLDELLPKATGGTHEARVEARLARRAEAKAREESPDLMAAGAANIIGGDDSFAAAKAREAKRQDWRGKQQAAKKEELAHKLSAAAQAEADKMAQFRALVAAQGGKMSIAKRQ